MNEGLNGERSDYAPAQHQAIHGANPMKNQGVRMYRVGATYRGERVVFTVEATTGPKAAAEARRQARAQGMQSITVNYVKPVERTIFRYSPDCGPPLTALGDSHNPPDIGAVHAGETPNVQGTKLSVDEINDRIRDVWERMVVFVPRPDEPPLKAYQQDGRVFLDDGVNGRQELLNRSPMELVTMMYEWATYVGYSSDDFEDFVDICWA